MEEVCSNASILARMACILTYSGDIKDIIINYAMVAANFLCCAVSLLSAKRDKELKTSFAAGSLIFVIVFQVVLCLVLGCAGVSIVWCAMMGWIIIMERKRQSEQEHYRYYFLASSRMDEMAAVLLLLCDLIVIVYYGFVLAEPITTVAHVCAVVLGAALSFLSMHTTTLR